MKRTDANQGLIVRALRQAGASVAVTSNVGSGFPDLVVGFRGQTWLLEVKDGAQAPSKRRLTPAEKEFHLGWQGHVAVVTTELEALREIGATRDRSYFITWTHSTESHAR